VLSGSQAFMQLKASIRRVRLAAGFACCVFIFLVSAAQCLAQAPPPLDVPSNAPAKNPGAIAIEGWLLYPTVRLYSTYTDNFFFTPQFPLSVGGVGVAPSLTAQWTNGIHTTTLYGNIDREVFPTANELNSFMGKVGFTQRYEALRDLIFSVNGNVLHQTLTTGLQNSIQTPAAAPATTILPNGNTQLPNGTIISPSGQTVGQASQTTGSSVPLVVNPFNQYTGTFSVDKIFNRGILGLTASTNRTEYENGQAQSNFAQSNFSSRTFTERAGVWLGPLFYAYSDGSIGTIVSDPTSTASSTSTTAYRVVGGLGTRQFDLYRLSFYFGHQGSQSSSTIGGAPNSGVAGGDVYGGVISYYPTAYLTFTGTLDRTTNISSQTGASNLALTLPTQLPIQVPLNSSGRITSVSLQSTYQIARQWFATGLLSYSRIESFGSSSLANAWTLDATLRYDIWRNMSLNLEYRYNSVVSNVPFASPTSNYVMTSAIYRF
jgi:Putative beta-barrel porin 2